jgi:hypothetical protein
MIFFVVNVDTTVAIVRSLGPSPQSVVHQLVLMAKKVWNEQSTGSRLVSGFLTALPITLIPGLLSRFEFLFCLNDPL